MRERPTVALFPFFARFLYKGTILACGLNLIIIIIIIIFNEESFVTYDVIFTKVLHKGTLYIQIIMQL